MDNQSSPRKRVARYSNGCCKFSAPYIEVIDSATPIPCEEYIDGSWLTNEDGYLTSGDEPQLKRAQIGFTE